MRTGLTLDDGWLASKCTKSHIQFLVEECLLQPQSIVQRQSALGHSRPFEQMGEIVTFILFIEQGFRVRTSDLFRALQYCWGIQAHHLTPNSIL